MATFVHLLLLLVICGHVYSYIHSDRKHLHSRQSPHKHDKRLLSKKSQHKITTGRVSFKECNLASEKHLDCGFPGITEEQCNMRECCWTPTEEPGVPTCYHSIPTTNKQCLLDNKEKQHCGWTGMRKEQCLAMECCWQPSIGNIPWCYEYKSVPVFEGMCGKTAIPPKTLSRVIGGEEAIPHSWPWIVSLQVNGVHKCGGSLINHQWILSAAHCANSLMDPANENMILLGAHSLSGDESTKVKVEMDKVIVHEDYRSGEHDVLLIWLKEPVEFNDAISPVCLASELPIGGSRCYSMGWGLDTYSYSEEEGIAYTAPDLLQQFMSPVIDQDLCNSTDWYNGQVHPSSMCAGYEEGGRGNCFGDSGGPLVCRENGVWKQVGIVSRGKPCALARSPTIYGEVSQHVAWMEKEILKYDN